MVVPVRVEVPVVADMAVTDCNDATAGDAGGARNGSTKGGGVASGGSFL